jgi:hypothetical protein
MVAVATVAARPASADVLKLKNGDTLHGTALGGDEKEIKFKHVLGNEMKFPWAEIQSVATDAPVEVKLIDGSRIKGKLEPGAKPGGATIATTAAGPIAVDFTNVAALNEPPEDVTWTGRLAIGATIQDGNTRSKSAFGSFDGERLSKFDRIEAHGHYTYASTKNPLTRESELSARKGHARIQYSYYFWKPVYIYAGGALEYDYFQNLRLRSRGGGGLGWAIVESKDLLLRVEGGVEYVNEDYRRGIEDRDFVALRGAFHGEWQVRPWLRLGEFFEIFPNTERFRDFFSRSVSSANIAVWDGLGFAAVVIWEHDQVPSDATRNKNDTQYILTLTYVF